MDTETASTLSVSNFTELQIAIHRTQNGLRDARTDWERERLTFHLDKLLEAEQLYFGITPLHEEAVDARTAMDEGADETLNEEPAEETDDEKINAKLEAGEVIQLPAKKARKKSNVSPEVRHASGERMRKMQCARKGIAFVPLPFEDSKYAKPGYDADAEKAAKAAAAPYGPRHSPPPEESTDPLEDFEIQQGGIDFRP